MKWCGTQALDIFIAQFDGAAGSHEAQQIRTLVGLSLIVETLHAIEDFRISRFQFWPRGVSTHLLKCKTSRLRL